MQIIANPERYATKEKMYLSVREAESRIVPDELLRQLPYVAENNPYHNEWQIRAQNLERLMNYLQRKSKGTRLSILDIGCGNGWMSHKLYDAGFKVTGMDLNLSELKQAERVFGTSDALNWVYADILEFNLPELYDIIIFGASCQYFPDITQLTGRLLPFLKKCGEIHLFDSMFYRATEIQEAKKGVITIMQTSASRK